MNDKPFKTYRQQMKHLRDVKKIDCQGSTSKQILLRNGYFNLINGYKIPFVLKVDNNGTHTYIGGTSIEHFEAVKHFDDELRHILLKYSTKLECCKLQTEYRLLFFFNRSLVFLLPLRYNEKDERANFPSRNNRKCSFNNSNREGELHEQILDCQCQWYQPHHRVQKEPDDRGWRKV